MLSGAGCTPEKKQDEEETEQQKKEREQGLASIAQKLVTYTWKTRGLIELKRLIETTASYSNKMACVGLNRTHQRFFQQELQTYLATNWTQILKTVNL